MPASLLAFKALVLPTVSALLVVRLVAAVPALVVVVVLACEHAACLQSKPTIGNQGAGPRLLEREVQVHDADGLDDLTSLQSCRARCDLWKRGEAHQLVHSPRSTTIAVLSWAAFCCLPRLLPLLTSRQSQQLCGERLSSSLAHHVAIFDSGKLCRDQTRL